MQYDVVIVGAGLSGLSCGHALHKSELSFVVLEAGASPGGRIQTDVEQGFQLDHGFQVLQTGYPEARSSLDFHGLELQRFPAGVAVRYNKRFHIIADPRRHPRHLLSTLAAPIGTLRDRLAMLRLARSVCRGPLPEIFTQAEERTGDFLRRFGFSQGFIERFFVPFFAGACLDQTISASSRVFQYIFRMFTAGDAALPTNGMGEIPKQLAGKIPKEAIRTNCTVAKVEGGVVTLDDGREIHGRRVVLATSQPAYEKLMGVPLSRSSLGESCLYFASSWRPPFREPFLVLNGDGQGPVNNIAFPSLVAPHYSASGKTLIAVVVLGKMREDSGLLEQQVRQQCFDWFGKAVQDWEHLRTYHIEHALPEQTFPTANPYVLPPPVNEKVRICGECQSLPGIQWALLSGRQTAEALIAELC
jgi:phytoene dehydrogenase-like protein